MKKRLWCVPILAMAVTAYLAAQPTMISIPIPFYRLIDYRNETAYRMLITDVNGDTQYLTHGTEGYYIRSGGASDDPCWADLTLRSAAAPGVSAVGQIALDLEPSATLDTPLPVYHDANQVMWIPAFVTLPSTDNHVLVYDAASDSLIWEAQVGGGGATAWDDIGNPDANDTIDFGAYFAALDVNDFRVGDTDGGNYFKIDGGVLTSVGTTTLDAGTLTEGGTGVYNTTESDAAYQPLEATLTDIADGTIAENLVNTANPWAVNEGGTGAGSLNDLITLATHTTGNYVATVADAGSATITVVGSGSENAAVTLDLADDAVGPAHIDASQDFGGIVSDASGNLEVEELLLAVWTAKDAVLPTSNYATPDVRGTHRVLDFDGTAVTGEYAYFEGVMPPGYQGSGLIVYLNWSYDGADANDVDFDVAFERIDAGTLDIDADSFAAANAADGTSNATSGITTTTSATFTDGADMDSVAAGEAFRLKITRDSNTDAGLDDVNLLRVWIKENN